MHDQGVAADADAVRAGVEVDALIDVRALLQRDVAREPEPDTPFDGRQAVHLQNETIGGGTDGDAQRRRDPPERAGDSLFEDVPRRRGRLPPHVKAEL